MAGLAAATIALASTTGCADGRKTPTVLPSSHRTAGAVFVVIGGRESSGSGLADALHTSWAQLVFRRQFSDGTVYVNLARNDSTVAEAKTEQMPLALEQRPTVAAVWLGEGDDDAGTSPARFGQDLRVLLDQLRRSGRSRVLVAFPPPSAPGSKFAPEIERAARIAGANLVPLSARAWDPGAPQSRQARVQAAAAAEFGRVLRR